MMSWFCDRQTTRWIKLKWKKRRKMLRNDDIWHGIKQKMFIWLMRINFVQWDKKINQTNDESHYFIECAQTINNVSRLLSHWCDDDITYSLSTRSRIIAIKNHRKKNCITRETNKYSFTYSMKTMIKISKMFLFFTIFFNEHILIIHQSRKKNIAWCDLKRQKLHWLFS